MRLRPGFTRVAAEALTIWSAPISESGLPASLQPRLTGQGAGYRGIGVRAQKKLVKLNTQRKTRKTAKAANPNAWSPKGPIRILDAAEFSIDHRAYDSLKRYEALYARRSEPSWQLNSERSGLIYSARKALTIAFFGRYR